MAGGNGGRHTLRGREVTCTSKHRQHSSYATEVQMHRVVVDEGVGEHTRRPLLSQTPCIPAALCLRENKGS